MFYKCVVFFCSSVQKGLDLAAKPISKVSASTTSARKRLSRKSPGPELRKTLRSIPPPTNVVGPETVISNQKKNNEF